MPHRSIAGYRRKNIRQAAGQLFSEDEFFRNRQTGQVGKCGLVIPITGFANSMASSAMEYKPEGFILGVGANTFKLAGTVVVFGVFSAFFVSAIKYLVWLL